MPERTDPSAPPEPIALPAVFRPARTRAVLLGCGGAACVALTAIALLLPRMRPAERVGFVFLGVLVLAVLMLLSRPRVAADAEGVTVVNILSSRRLAWAEVLGVQLRAGDPWVFLDLSDGTSMPAMGIQPGLAREHAVRDARALRALTVAHSQGGPVPGTDESH